MLKSLNSILHNPNGAFYKQQDSDLNINKTCPL